MPRIVQSILDLSIFIFWGIKKLYLLPTSRIYLACPLALSIAASDSIFSQGCGFVTVDSPDSELKGTLENEARASASFPLAIRRDGGRSGFVVSHVGITTERRHLARGQRGSVSNISRILLVEISTDVSSGED